MILTIVPVLPPLTCGVWINDADIAIGMRINEQPAGNANKRRITGGKTNLETPKSRKIGCKGVSQRGRKKSVNKGGRGIMRQNPCLVKGERTVKMLVRNLKSAVCNLPAKDHTHGFTLPELNHGYLNLRMPHLMRQ